MRNRHFAICMLCCLALARGVRADSADEAAIKAAVVASMSAVAGDVATYKANAVGYDPELIDAVWDVFSAMRAMDAAAAQQFATSNKPHPQRHPDVEALRQSVERELQGKPIRITGDTASIMINDRSVPLKRVNGQWLLDASRLFPPLPPTKAKVVPAGLHLLAAQMRNGTREIVAGAYPDWPTASRALDRNTIDALRNDPEVSRGWKDAFGNVPFGPEPLVKWMTSRSAPDPVAPHPAGPAVAGSAPATQPIRHEDDNAATDAARTELVGGKGGGEFTKASVSGVPITALRYSMGRWSNRPVIREIDPVFEGTEKDQPPLTKDMKLVTARKGYVLGGMVVDTDQKNATAFKAIFVRYKDGRVDPADQYLSDWCGTPAGQQHQQKLAGTGEKVVGLCGRKGLNVDALGLVIEGSLKKTARAGGDGGSPFTTAGPNNALVVGFRYSMGDWGRPVLRQLDPIFDVAGNDAPPGRDEQIVRAKAGYAVGGVLADTDDTNTVAVKITFFRRKGDSLDPTDSYTSDWIGTPSGVRQLQLAGHGEKVIGTFGRKGLNLDGFGLLVLGDEPAKKTTKK